MALCLRGVVTYCVTPCWLAVARWRVVVQSVDGSSGVHDWFGNHSPRIGEGDGRESMGSINAIDNYDRLSKDFLAPGTRRLLGGESVQGEHVQVSAIDGRFRVLDARQDGTRDDSVRWVRATLMMTERHAIAYQARGGFRRDYGIAVPYRSLAVVSYRLLAARHGKMAMIGMRFEPRNGGDPMLEFATDVDDAFAYDAVIKTVLTACAIGGIRTSDESDRATMDALGLRPVPGGNYVDPSIAAGIPFGHASHGMQPSDSIATDDTPRRMYRSKSYTTLPNGVANDRRYEQERSPQRNARYGGMHSAEMPHGETLRDNMSDIPSYARMDAHNARNNGGNRLTRSHNAVSGSSTPIKQSGNGNNRRRIGV